LALQQIGSPLVILVVGMLATIGFDDQHMFEAGEIGNVRADRNLTAELVPVQAPITQE
jgi:hypothetical protein